MKKLVLAALLIAPSAFATEFKNLISCHEKCKLVQNPTTILPQQSYYSEVSLSYNFTCNPGISANSIFRSELKIKDLGSGSNITLEYFYLSPIFTLTTKGPLIVQDDLPLDMASIIEKPCDLIIKVNSKLEPSTEAQYVRRIEDIEQALPPLFRSFSSGKSLMKSLISNRLNLGCTIHNLDEETPSLTTESLKKVFDDLFHEPYTANAFVGNVCAQAETVNVEDFSCINHESSLCLAKNIYSDARSQLAKRYAETISLSIELKDTSLNERLLRLNARSEFDFLRN